MFLNRRRLYISWIPHRLNRKHEMFLNAIKVLNQLNGKILNRKHEMFLNQKACGDNKNISCLQLS